MAPNPTGGGAPNNPFATQGPWASGANWRPSYLNMSGKGAPGKPLGKAPGGAPGGAATGGTTGGTSGVTPPAPNPFLTPAQQAAWSTYQNNYGNQMAGLTAQFQNAGIKTTANEAAVTLKEKQQEDMMNQVMAARGMFQSSIHGGALNDLTAHLTMSINNMNTALHTMQNTIQGNMGTATSNYDATQRFYNQQMVQNAQGITPTPNTPGTPPTNTPNTTGGTTRGQGGWKGGAGGWGSNQNPNTSGGLPSPKMTGGSGGWKSGAGGWSNGGMGQGTSKGMG